MVYRLPRSSSYCGNTLPTAPSVSMIDRRHRMRNWLSPPEPLRPSRLSTLSCPTNRTTAPAASTASAAQCFIEPSRTALLRGTRSSPTSERRISSSRYCPRKMCRYSRVWCTRGRYISIASTVSVVCAGRFVRCCVYRLLFFRVYGRLV